MAIKVTDFIAQSIEALGVKHVFMISGGGAMHLNDSIGKCNGIQYICNHHEQASAIGAEGYARATGKPGVVVVTSGPGGTNTLTGVLGQWLDSVPVIYLSGQVKTETTIESCRNLGLRQLGDQEINITDIVRPITKFAEILRTPADVKWLFEKAVYICTHGRPGPVWIDIPLDIQGAMVEENELKGFDDKEAEESYNTDAIHRDVLTTLEMLKKAERPVFLAGHGIRIAGAQRLFLEVIEKMGIPVISTFNGFDLIPSAHPLYAGRIGTIGDRAGNFALQNSDLLLSVGSRNNIRQISYNWSCFARSAKKIIVDVDPSELKKPTVQPDLPIEADAKIFLEILKKELEGEKLPSFDGWMRWCGERKKRYPVVLPAYRKQGRWVNPYYFIEVLTKTLSSDAVVVAGNGTACVTLFQAGIVKSGQRFFWNSGCASMGYDLPASIGASIGLGKTVICLAGEGSLQMNMQELQTVVFHKLPLKIFVLNNKGYASIKQTQESFFGGHYVACDEKSGVSFPDMKKISKAYGLGYQVIKNHRSIEEKIRNFINKPGPEVCEVMLMPDYKFSPKLSSERKPDGRIVSKPLEDMFPFLERVEFRKNMIIKEQE
jgi:acetolactate synthase-1/2/3 large subunit